MDLTKYKMSPKSAIPRGGFVLLLTLLQGVACNKDIVIDEYCNDSIMELKCKSHQVILMESARYGRVKLGGCVKKDMGFLGCAVDVLRQIDARCSGRQTCEVSIMDSKLRALQPCPSDVTWHLEAAYRCVSVETASVSSCHSKQYSTITSTSGFLSSSIASHTGVGTPSCPWQIKAQPGQRINITAYNFITSIAETKGLDEGSVANPGVCYQFATVEEGFSKRTLTVCSGESREKVMYLSNTHSVKIVFLTRQAHEHPVQFILQYKVQGCADLSPKSRGMWMKRTGDDLRVKCNRTGETWYLTCSGDKWLGQLGNCSDESSKLAATGGGTDTQWKIQQLFGGTSDFPVGILIIVSVGVALGVFLGGTLLIVVALHMKRKRRAKAARAACLDPGYLSSDAVEIKPPRAVPLYDESDNYNLPKDYFKIGHTDTMEKAMEFTTTTGDTRNTAAGTIPPPPYGRQSSGSHLYESPKVSL